LYTMCTRYLRLWSHWKQNGPDCTWSDSDKNISSNHTYHNLSMSVTILILSLSKFKCKVRRKQNCCFSISQWVRRTKGERKHILLFPQWLCGLHQTVHVFMMADS
jgi:hypothetical protein